jgi:hypothetical protein
MRVIGLYIQGELGESEEVKSVSKTLEVEDVTGPEGHWVVVVRGKVIATSDDLQEMLRLAERHPSADTLVTKVLYPQASFF